MIAGDIKINLRSRRFYPRDAS